LGAQLLLGTVDLLVDLGPSSLEQSLALGTRLALRLLDDLGGTLLGLRDQFGGLLLGLGEQFLGALLGQFLLMLAALGGRETVGQMNFMQNQTNSANEIS
jgi:hypothetical protein